VKGKKILIGITGSIAAYKIPLLVRLLIKAGAEIKVVMTPSAAEFVSPLVLSTLSKNKVSLSLSTDHSWENHVMMGRWADIMLIAPASANTMAKMAQGLCDNLLLAAYLSATCPVHIAPAMDEDMYHHPSFIANCEKLRSYGNTILESNHGELASGLIGMGRMAEVEEIFEHLQKQLSTKGRLKGKKALVTAGPTYENLDPVRFIGNYSSGKMGLAVAEALAEEGAEVTLVMGPSVLRANHSAILQIDVQSAQEMFDACQNNFSDTDIAVMSAAVADYRPKIKAPEKIKKKSDELSLELEKTTDILKTLGNNKKPNQIVVGFALESKDEEKHAQKKLKDKNADLIVLNSIKDEGAGFMKDTNKVTIFNKNGTKKSYDLKSKKEVARDIVAQIIELKNEKAEA
jgi:phosphopantothenoylcysteine decarboxylase/phosphopantothenate--cysteine ligase